MLSLKAMNFFALPALVAGFTSQAGIIVAVGAQNAFIIRQGVARSHVPQILAICIGADLLMISLGTEGMSNVVTGHPAVLKALTWLGAAVLLIYGIMAFIRVFGRVRGLFASTRASHTGMVTQLSQSASEQHPGNSNSLKKTVLLCLGFTFLNPGVYVDSLVLLGSIAVTYGALKWSFAAGAMMCSVVWFILLGLLSATMSRIFSSARAWIILDSVIGVTMMLLAVHLVLR